MPIAQDPQRHSGAEHPVTPAKKPPYRLGGLDGLRAFAALAVLAYHYLPRVATGGLLGVDVFFVLSGFLITALLTAEFARLGRIRIGHFWVRRFRRLFPAVATAVLFCVAIAPFASKDLLVGIRQQVFGSLTFTANWVDIATGQSYFTDANPQLLRNMWSLAVEQQFYLVWPLILLLLILRLPRRWQAFVPLLFATVAIGAMWILFHMGTNPTRIYEGTGTHSMGLMLGAALALAGGAVLSPQRPQIPRLTAALRGILGWIGFGAIFVLFFALPTAPSFLYPWGFTLASIATVAVIQSLLPEVAGSPGAGWVLRKFLDWRPLVWLGERSYSLYLWHWPVFMLLRATPHLKNQWLIAALATIISLLAATLSYRYVETPMREHGIFRTLWLGLRGLVAPRRFGGAQNALRRLDLALAAALLILVPCGAAFAIVNAPEKTQAQLNVERGEAQLDKQSKPQAQATKPQQPTAKAPDKAVELPVEKEPPPPNPLAPDMVTVIGDSVTVASAGELAEALPGAAIDAKVSRSNIVGLQILNTLRSQGQLRPYLVFALATNSDMTVEQVREVVQAAGPKTRIVFVTGFGPSYDDWIFRTNEHLRQVQREFPKRVRIADWEQAIKDKLELLASDQTHPGPEGARIYTQAVVNALKSFQK